LCKRPLNHGRLWLQTPRQRPPAILDRRSPHGELLLLRWVALCFAATFAVYLVFVPRILLYSSPPTGDQAYYLMDTISLVQDFDVNVANNYAQHDEDKFYSLAPHPPGFVGIAAPYPLPSRLGGDARSGLPGRDGLHRRVSQWHAHGV
jgi:hypothetical protein